MSRWQIIRTFALAIILGLTACAPAKKATITEESFRASQQTMEKISVINKKLIQMAESNKDLDALEQEGLSKADVNRMRRAMRHKVRQLTDENIQLIKAL